ncbi:hypothetical protein HY495_00790 [Candidatus Woesearchaeota archaeon]|nr:hypothetical protein [Candidatus Woesearchaeota archaeon]
MDRKIVQPKQIIVPGEYELGNQSILKIYFRVFDRGHGGDLPPVIVAHNSIGNRGERYFTLNPRIVGDYRNRVQSYINKGAEYFLLDGNHRAVASALTDHPIDTLELQSDEDIKKFRKMVERGELFDWEQESGSLIEIVDDFEFFCWEHLDEMMTVEERVKQLTSNGDLPQYMTDKYLQDKLI